VRLLLLTVLPFPDFAGKIKFAFNRSFCTLEKIGRLPICVPHQSQHNYGTRFVIQRQKVLLTAKIEFVCRKFRDSFLQPKRTIVDFRGFRFVQNLPATTLER